MHSLGDIARKAALRPLKPHGLVTVLLRMAPGAILPDHEHVLVEQTYMLEGRLVDKEGRKPALRSAPAISSGAPRGAAMPPIRRRAA